jgi:hypothetical protein
MSRLVRRRREMRDRPRRVLNLQPNDSPRPQMKPQARAIPPLRAENQQRPDSLAERGEFELPVPICEQSDAMREPTALHRHGCCGEPAIDESDRLVDLEWNSGDCQSGLLRLIPSDRIREASVFGLMARSSAAPPAPEILQCARSNAVTMLSRSIRFKSSPRVIFVLEEFTGSSVCLWDFV